MAVLARGNELDGCSAGGVGGLTFGEGLGAILAEWDAVSAGAGDFAGGGREAWAPTRPAAAVAWW